MQYNSHYQRDKSSYDFSRHIFNTNAYYRGCNIFPHQNSKQQYLGCDKEAMRQIMLKQDEMFRNQVRELHRLYTRQMELMDCIKDREIYAQDLHLRSKSIFGDVVTGKRFPGFDSFSSSFDLNEEKSSLTLSTGKAEEQPRSSRIGCISNNDSKILIDLNEPFEPESLISSSNESSCLRDRNKGFVIDLNTVPRDFPSETDFGHENFLPGDSEEKMMCPLREGIFSSEEPVEEVDRVAAAEALLAIFSSSAARNDGGGSSDVTASWSPLSWFADVVSSLVNLSRAVRKETRCGSRRFSARNQSARSKECGVLLRDWGKVKNRGGFRRSKFRGTN